MELSKNNRREFLKAGTAALAATAFSSSARSYAAIAGANDRVRVGIVGCGDRMKQGDLPAFQTSAKDMNFQIVAVSDIWSRRREEGAAFIEKLCGNRRRPGPQQRRTLRPQRHRCRHHCHRRFPARVSRH